MRQHLFSSPTRLRTVAALIAAGYFPDAGQNVIHRHVGRHPALLLDGLQSVSRLPGTTNVSLTGYERHRHIAESAGASVKSAAGNRTTSRQTHEIAIAWHHARSVGRVQIAHGAAAVPGLTAKVAWRLH